jgi:phage recombination protein Bet
VTTTDVAVRNGQPPSAALAIRPGQEMFTDKQRAALAVLGIKDASNADLAVYMHYCQKTGLDPFSRQIYMIARREKQDGQWVSKQTIQVGIDGFRVIRDRIAARLGVTVEYEDTIWYDADGGAHKVWLWDTPPAACCVTVIKDGKRFPGVVRTAAYAARNREGELVSQWRTQPDHMIEKCAEAYALRRAFPNDLGGLYLEDEMPEPVWAPQPVSPVRVTAEEITQQPPAPEPAPEPEREREPRAGKTLLAKLDALLRKIPLGPQPDVQAFLDWRAGGQYTATRPQAEAITGELETALAVAEGDPAEAAAALWAAYSAEHEQEAAEAGQAGSDGN